MQRPEYRDYGRLRPDWEWWLLAFALRDILQQLLIGMDARQGWFTKRPGIDRVSKTRFRLVFLCTSYCEMPLWRA